MEIELGWVLAAGGPVENRDALEGEVDTEDFRELVWRQGEYFLLVLVVGLLVLCQYPFERGRRYIRIDLLK